MLANHSAIFGLREKGHQAIACRQPTARLTDQAEPSHTGRSPLRTSSGRHAGSVYGAGDGRVRIDNLYFIFFNKHLMSELGQVKPWRRFSRRATELPSN
jgi:hypothetical protein